MKAVCEEKVKASPNLFEAMEKISEAICCNMDREGRFVKGAVRVALGSHFSKEGIAVLREYAQVCGVAKVIPQRNRSQLILTFRRR